MPSQTESLNARAKNERTRNLLASGFRHSFTSTTRRAFATCMDDAHMNRTILAVALVFLTIATAADKPTLKQLYDRHRWFDLRDAIKDQDAPPLYKGAVASALNHPKEAELFQRRDQARSQVRSRLRCP
jgi:hypothetical protein